jgi:hypothetical protein
MLKPEPNFIQIKIAEGKERICTDIRSNQITTEVFQR